MDEHIADRSPLTDFTRGHSLISLPSSDDDLEFDESGHRSRYFSRLPDHGGFCERDWEVRRICDKQCVGPLVQYKVHWAPSLIRFCDVEKPRGERQFVKIDGNNWYLAQATCSPHSDGGEEQEVEVHWEDTWHYVWALTNAGDAIRMFEHAQNPPAKSKETQPVFWNRRRAEPEILPPHPHLNPAAEMCIEDNQFQPLANTDYTLNLWRYYIDNDLWTANPNTARFLNLPIRQPLAFTPCSDSSERKRYNLDRNETLRALLAYPVGSARSEPCGRCASGYGAFVKCVTEDNNFKGACLNCVIARKGLECEHHHKDRVFRAPAIYDEAEAIESTSECEIGAQSHGMSSELDPQVGHHVRGLSSSVEHTQDESSQTENDHTTPSSHALCERLSPQSGVSSAFDEDAGEYESEDEDAGEHENDVEDDELGAEDEDEDNFAIPEETGFPLSASLTTRQASPVVRGCKRKRGETEDGNDDKSVFPDGTTSALSQSPVASHASSDLRSCTHADGQATVEDGDADDEHSSYTGGRYPSLSLSLGSTPVRLHARTCGRRQGSSESLDGRMSEEQAGPRSASIGTIDVRSDTCPSLSSALESDSQEMPSRTTSPAGSVFRPEGMSQESNYLGQHTPDSTSDDLDFNWAVLHDECPGGLHACVDPQSGFTAPDPETLSDVILNDYTFRKGEANRKQVQFVMSRASCDTTEAFHQRWLMFSTAYRHVKEIVYYDRERFISECMYKDLNDVVMHCCQTRASFNGTASREPIIID